MMALITLSRKLMVGKAPPSATAGQGNEAAVFSRDVCPPIAPYLILTSDLYRIQAETITITVPSNING